MIDTDKGQAPIELTHDQKEELTKMRMVLPKYDTNITEAHRKAKLDAVYDTAKRLKVRFVDRLHMVIFNDQMKAEESLRIANAHLATCIKFIKLLPMKEKDSLDIISHNTLKSLYSSIDGAAKAVLEKVGEPYER